MDSQQPWAFGFLYRDLDSAVGYEIRHLISTKKKINSRFFTTEKAVLTEELVKLFRPNGFVLVFENFRNHFSENSHSLPKIVADIFADRSNES